MKRSLTATALLWLCASLFGCGGNGSSNVDPSKLPALTDEDRAQMKQHDEQVQQDEKAQQDLTPAVKKTRSQATNERF